MKKLATFVLALLLAGDLSFVQTGGSTEPADTAQPAAKDAAKKSGTKLHKRRQGGNKGKKSSGGDTAANTPK